MKIGKIFRYIGFLAVLIPFSTVACSGNEVTLRSPGNRSPKFLLTGDRDSSVGEFVYYSINGGTEYAVALTQAAKSNTGSITIPNEYNDKPVTGIWRSGFYESNYSTVSIPISITVIDYEAFLGSKITSVSIPATVTDIGEGAFYSCRELTKVAIQNSTGATASSACSCSEIIDDDSGERTYSSLSVIPSFCFFNCVKLKEIVLPESIEEIEYEAFNGCIALYSTLAFMNIKTIRSRAFQNCISLRSIYIASAFFDQGENNEPEGIIEEHAFNNCNSDLTFHFSGNSTDINTWLNLSRNLNHWNQISEYSNPASANNQFSYDITAGGAHYSNDWIYTTTGNDVELTSYIGPTEIEGNPVEFLSLPNELPSGSGNYVRSFAKDALLTVRANLKRIYLPTTLKRIDNSQFDSTYTNLVVIDDNTACAGDETRAQAHQDLIPRIILNKLTSLEVIGTRAFLNMPKLNTITKLYLPYSVKVVGSRAFGTSEKDCGNKHLRKVTDFRWYYDDSNSALEIIGKEAFYKLGQDDASTSLTGTIHQGHLNNDGTEKYSLTTLVIPRKFKHFGVFSGDATTYNLSENDGNDASNAFAACPLLSKVVFKGSLKSVVSSATSSTVDNNVTNLVVGQQTFVMNESLRTIVVEERVGKGVGLFTGNDYKPVFGWSSGHGKNDLGGDPTIQTIVLPNKYTNLVVQNHALQGNSRGALYLSGADTGNKIKGSVVTNISNFYNNPTSSSFVITDSRVSEWHRIGEENTDGYYFDSSKKNSFGLNQQMPIYTNVLYKDTINVTGVSTEVEVGTGNTREYVTQNKCAFVTGITTGKATMTNYLYDRYDGTFNGTATVPGTVSNSAGNNFTVNIIGDSAFSADHCDSTSYSGLVGHPDLTAVVLPDSIETIGAYAFMRAYSVTKVSSATGGDYTMPSSLAHIGKHAFAFCHVQKVLNIPLTCLFYENENATTNETSVFSNNFYLRQITFGNGATSSSYYTTTTYTSSGGATYTSALYSTDNDNVLHNKSSLLLVLNRDVADDHAVSDDLSHITENGVHYGKFDGQRADRFLYGAFKMCYWLKWLIVGTASDSSSDLDQPLISGIIDTNPIYLGYEIKDFTSFTCNLKIISFGTCELQNTPSYAFEGCEQLTKVELPIIEGGTIPEGLFSYITANNMQFVVPANADGSQTKTCQPGELDLTYTKYTRIKADAFKGSTISTFIAPKTANFTIEDGAFENCTITSFDFSNVTNSVNLTGCFRGATVSTSSSFDFGSAAIYFNKQVFKGAKFPEHSFSFPVNTAVIGESCFEACNVSGKELTTVTADGVLNNLVPVEADAGLGENNDSSVEGAVYQFKQIGDFAFYMCTKLTNFDFTNFSEIERIGHFAFSMNNKIVANTVNIAPDQQASNNTATICAGGIVDLPSKITNLGTGCFNNSAIKEVTINSSSMKFERGKEFSSVYRCGSNRGGHTFRNCFDLEKVYFSNPHCLWKSEYLEKKRGNDSNNDQSNYFSNCKKLKVVYLPDDFELQHFENLNNDTLRPDSMVWDSNASLRVYLYHTLDDVDLSVNHGVCIYWHRISGSVYDNLVYNVNNSSELVEYVDGQYKLKTKAVGTKFWKRINGQDVFLGTATVNSSTGLVTFKDGNTTTGTADANGVYAA